MKASRYATSRQKACQSCSVAKARCDRNTNGCSRCAQRDLPCIYPHCLPPPGGRVSELNFDQSTNASGDSTAISFSTFPEGLLSGSPQRLHTQAYTPSSGDTPELATDGSYSRDPPSTAAVNDRISAGSSLNATAQFLHEFDRLEYSGLDLRCPINADDIRNRWLNSYVPVPGQKIKTYPAPVTAFIYRMLKSYVAVAVRGRGVPPFVHASQISSRSVRPPLSVCLTLVRMCEKPLLGSEPIAAKVLQREMDDLYEEYRTQDTLTLLSTFQAYLIYSMVLFFHLGQGGHSSLRQAMMNLQDLACGSSQQGLVCAAERQQARPKWEAWIICESKRRTLFTMYLFDSLLSAQDGLPTFLGIELQGLPASSSQFLWKARSRQEWEAEYHIHLTHWVDGGLRIDELWPAPEHLSEIELIERRRRVDLWLETVDEFGTMLYAVTSCTHGG